ncbi:hypothetical protein ACU4GD_18570 [Cupriavidus basilensis]
MLRLLSETKGAVQWVDGKGRQGGGAGYRAGYQLVEAHLDRRARAIHAGGTAVYPRRAGRG